MNLILYKEGLYNSDELANEVETNEFLGGLIIGASMTKDNKIIVYNIATNNQVCINNIQNGFLEDLRKNCFVELDDFLYKFRNYKNKIIINLTGCPVLIDNPNKNEGFIIKIREVLNNYPHLNLYICSAYDDIITFINRYLNAPNIKRGMIVYKGNLNYYDVNFYIIPNDMFDTEIVAQQMTLKKEIMLTFENGEDIVSIINKFKKSNYLFNNIEKNVAKNLLHIVTKAPRVMHTYLQNKK